ncbi:MAG TPA: hypothetical protein VGM62_07430, partial [Chthoniobacterales bacterium]
LTDWITQSLPQRQSFADWQIQHFGSTSNPLAAAEADPDGDGQTNYQEFLAYTDPNNAASAQAPATVVDQGGLLHLSFVQPADRSAVVEISLDLQTWTLWDVPGNMPSYPGQAMQRTLTIPSGPDHEFFRLQLSAP